MHQQNQSLREALYACVAACEHCALACLPADHVQMMARCIALDRAASCALAARRAARGSEQLSGLQAVCAEVCRGCATRNASRNVAAKTLATRCPGSGWGT